MNWGYRLCANKGGKSGQHRAAHHLTGGVSSDRDTDSATENNRLVTKVRVKM